MELTAEHREILEAIGGNGVASEQLGELVNGHAFAELVDGDYLESEEFPLRETGEGGRLPDVQSVIYWRLTPLASQTLSGI